MKRLLALSLAILAMSAADANAGSAFVVNETGHEGDLVAGGACDVSANPGDQCTLRAAIELGNEDTLLNTVSFLIPGPGPHTIDASTLPPIDHPLFINGYSQPGSASNSNGFPQPLTTEIEIFLDGSEDDRGSSGLSFQTGASGSVVQGLAIGNVPGAGIQILNSHVTVRGNFIGTNAAGTKARPNREGLLVLAPGAINTQIGGSAVSNSNLISGNREEAIVATTPVQVEGNYIGTKRDGKSPLPNTTKNKFSKFASVNLLGDGSDKILRNIVAGSSGPAITLPNDNAGSLLSANRLFRNNGIGIDLGDDNVTPNDPLDPDSGPNTLQNFPVITKAKRTGGTTTVEAVLETVPNEPFIIELFQADGKSRQGKVYLGGWSDSTDEEGEIEFSLELAKPKKGKFVTATATRIAAGDLGATSEFAKPVKVK